MNSKNLLTFQAVVAILFSIPLLAMTTSFLVPYLHEPDTITPVTLLMTRGYGAILLAYGIGCWIVRGHENHKPWVTMLTISNVIHLIVYLIEYQQGYLNSMFFTSIGVVAILSLWGLIVLFKK